MQWKYITTYFTDEKQGRTTNSTYFGCYLFFLLFIGLAIVSTLIPRKRIEPWILLQS